MNLRSIFNGIIRLIVEKSGSNQRIKYLRNEGVRIGDNCIIETMSFSTEPYLIEIGNNVGISNGTVFITHDAGVWCFSSDLPNADIFGKIKVGNKVFIGINCTILPNTSIGNNCIIGAGSVVRGKFPDN
jgi:acetyltransferase-like isoleucine patch superfamily enzyme